MKTIGFFKSTMPDETRVAILPDSLESIVNKRHLFVEEGYASHIGISDESFTNLGVNVVPRNYLRNVDVLCIPKPWEGDERLFSEGKTLWGWLYLSQTPHLKKEVVDNKMTTISFERMFDNGRNVFFENTIIAGHIGMLQALPYAGAPPNQIGKIAVLGKGNVAFGVFQVLDLHNINYDIFHTNNVSDFFENMGEYDMIVNCVRLPNLADNFLFNKDARKLKNGCFLVDISSEGVEFSNPHPIHSPVYEFSVDKGHTIKVYNNEHIPALWPKYSSEKISAALTPYIQDIIEEKENQTLNDATLISKGILLDTCFKK